MPRASKALPRKKTAAKKALAKAEQICTLNSRVVLLPSGGVMSCGWTSNTIDVFRPPYLFKGAGPVIDTLPALVHHGRQFTIQTAQAADIRKVVMVRPMAPTHNTDSEQHVIQLSFYVSGAGEVTATAPDGWHPHAIAPRGYYMVFILNAAGAPSEAKFIQLH